MVSRTGILSDKSFADNCLEYRALPVGYATTHLSGHEQNPEYLGIKTPKYQKAAAKPVSADVLAVNLSKNFAGNRAANARQILDLYSRQAKEFKPPPVEIVGAYHYRMNSDFEIEQFKPEYTQPVSIHPRVSRPSRGDQILKQSVATSSATAPRQALEIALRKRDAAGQKKASIVIYDKLMQRGVEPALYFPEAPHKLDTATKWLMYISKQENRITDTMRLIDIGLARGANVDYLQAINPNMVTAQKLSEASSSTAPIQTQATTESSLSGANTAIDAGAVGQGVAINAKPAGIPSPF